jgi:hypothetical protein
LSEVGEESGDQKSAFYERPRIFDHAAEHSTNLLRKRSEFFVAFDRYVFAVFCKIQRRIGLAVLTVTVGQFANKVSLISSFGPGFP